MCQGLAPILSLENLIMNPFQLSSVYHEGETLAMSTNENLNARLEKAIRRTELLSYAAAGLGAAILFSIIIIAFLWAGKKKRGWKGVAKELDDNIEQTLEQTIKRIERLNRILTVAVVVEAIALVIFL